MYRLWFKWAPPKCVNCQPCLHGTYAQSAQAIQLTGQHASGSRSAMQITRHLPSKLDREEPVAAEMVRPSEVHAVDQVVCVMGKGGASAPTR